MHFSFSAINENDDENEIPFSAEKESHLCLYDRTYLRFSWEHNIFGQTQITFWNENEK